MGSIAGWWDEVRYELRVIVENDFAELVDGWVADARAQRQADAPGGERVGDGAGVGHPAREPVELGHDERVAGANGCPAAPRFVALNYGTGAALPRVIIPPGLGIVGRQR